MQNRNYNKKDIKIGKHEFRLEIYPSIVCWEIFPKNYQACLYAFSNKEKIDKIVESKYVLEK